MGRRFAAIAVGVISALALGTGVASASTGWAFEPTPNAAGATGSGLSGVSCPSTTACTAVGGYENSSGIGVALVEGWNGTRWAIQSIPIPAGATGSYLSGVSCPSTTACTAVGFYENSSDVLVTSAWRWNGTNWTIQSIPIPAGATDSGLSGVSCPSTTVCAAVGFYLTSSGTNVALAERWNGTSWAIQSIPIPAGAAFSLLFGVSCPSTTACTAVGFYGNSSDTDVALAERWNGTNWAIQSIRSPAGATGSLLYGVSCPSTTACTAVGSHSNSRSGVGVTLAERWLGTG